MKYEEISIGMKESLSHLVTQSDIEKFVDLTGDDNKLHVDKDFAATTSFKKPVVHGMIGASFISTIIGTKLPGDGALWFSQTLEFLLPVRVGDQLQVLAEVVKKNDNERIIDLKIEILNQNRLVVTKGYSRVKVIEQEVPEVVEKPVASGRKVALVVGGTGGIGQAVCLQLGRDGFDVMVHYRNNAEKAATIGKELEAMGRQVGLYGADLNREAEIEEMIRLGLRKFGRIDVLVNCAASPIPPVRVLDLEWSDFSTQLDLNIRVNLQLIKAVLPGMMEANYGKIITIGSIYSDKPNMNLVHYTTAKSALEGFTKSLALELAPKGIRVNMVSPSVISTELTADIPEKVKLLTAAQTPLRRLALPEDVAGAVGFLAGSGSDFMSGEVLRVNGGQLMK